MSEASRQEDLNLLSQKKGVVPLCRGPALPARILEDRSLGECTTDPDGREVEVGAGATAFKDDVFVQLGHLELGCWES